MRVRLLLLALVLALGVTSVPDALAQSPPARAAGTDPGGLRPTPVDQSAAAEAGRQAGAPGGRPRVASGASGPDTAAAGPGPPTFAVARVFATQYHPNTPGSVEVAVPDKCAKFAALRNTSALSSHRCPPGYLLGLDYRVLVIRDGGQAGVFPVGDVGPWNTDDNYWDFGPGAPRPRRLFADLPTGTPEAHAAFYNDYNRSANCKNLNGTLSGRADGADQFGRCVLNPGGLDLSVAAAAQLGLGNLQNDWVTVAYFWSPIRTSVAAVHSGQDADVADGSTADGARVVQWPRHGGLNQQWRFEQVASDSYRIVSVRSGKVLDVAGGSTADGAPVIQWAWHGGANQRWRLEAVAEGQFRLVSVASGKAIDVGGASTSPGAALIQWPWHGGANQRWRLSPLGTG